MPALILSCSKRRFALVVVALGSLAGNARAVEPTANVVEFYNPGLDHYFLTATPNESASLGPGWIRTGVEWSAWASPFDAPDIAPVCRVNGAATGVPGVVFYTASASECAIALEDPN